MNHLFRIIAILLVPALLAVNQSQASNLTPITYRLIPSPFSLQALAPKMVSNQRPGDAVDSEIVNLIAEGSSHPSTPVTVITGWEDIRRMVEQRDFPGSTDKEWNNLRQKLHNLYPLQTIFPQQENIGAGLFGYFLGLDEKHHPVYARDSDELRQLMPKFSGLIGPRGFLNTFLRPLEAILRQLPEHAVVRDNPDVPIPSYFYKTAQAEDKPSVLFFSPELRRPVIDIHKLMEATPEDLKKALGFAVHEYGHEADEVEAIRWRNVAVRTKLEKEKAAIRLQLTAGGHKELDTVLADHRADVFHHYRFPHHEGFSAMGDDARDRYNPFVYLLHSADRQNQELQLLLFASAISLYKFAGNETDATQTEKDELELLTTLNPALMSLARRLNSFVYGYSMAHYYDPTWMNRYLAAAAPSKNSGIKLNSPWVVGFILFALLVVGGWWLCPTRAVFAATAGEQFASEAAPKPAMLGQMTKEKEMLTRRIEQMAEPIYQYLKNRWGRHVCNGLITQTGTWVVDADWQQFLPEEKKGASSLPKVLVLEASEVKNSHFLNSLGLSSFVNDLYRGIIKQLEKENPIRKIGSNLMPPRMTIAREAA